MTDQNLDERELTRFQNMSENTWLSTIFSSLGLSEKAIIVKGVNAEKLTHMLFLWAYFNAIL